MNTEIARIDPEVRTVKRAARELERKRRAGLDPRKDRLRLAPPLPLLRELTDVAAGDAWVTYLAFDAKGIELTGQAARPAR